MYDLGRWQRYSEHRANVHETITAARAEGDRSLALVGAGRCYDADLRQLSEAFDRIALVDIDDAAVRAGIAGQGADQIAVVAPFDVTKDTLPETFDGIVSQCLLSQLMRPSLDAFEGDELVAAVQGVRAAHLRFVLGGVRSGGWAVLVWDIVASETTPEILNGPRTRRATERIAERAIAAGNYFSGLAPQLILKTIETDPWLKGACAGGHITRPWIWTDEPDHARIVYGMIIRRT